MATPFTNIYQKVTSLLQSYTFANLGQELFEEFLQMWLNEASSVYFIDCEKNLDNVDLIGNQFNETLTSREEWILAYSICLSYLNYFLADEQKLQNTLGDRDYQSYSPANLLKELRITTEHFERRLKEALELYSYREMW